jgi:hypothetical protein
MDINKVGPAKSWRLVYDSATLQVRDILHTEGYTETIFTVEEFGTVEELHQRITVLGLLMPAASQDDSLPGNG